ncbi:hypothetical protein NFI96_016662 [Prochilodus magdalenae]|nr:hypothetical protein NFI96_016662 [Prochilodus magdalenae]
MKIEDPDENSNEAQISNTSLLSVQQRLSSNTGSATVNNNFLGRLNQYCQQTNQSPDIKLVKSRGPAHNPVFVYKVVINKNEYPEGEGKTAKEAKQKAAQLALSEIEGHAEWSSQSSFMSSSISENDSSPQNSVNESEDDVNQSQSTSDFIVFQDSPVSAGNINKPVPKPSPLDVKPKIKLAANFQNSPDRNREETPRRKDHNLTKASTKGTPASNTSAKSRFLEDFASISKIGKGGFGRVFKARKKLEKKYYAVKIVVCTDKSLREVGTLAELIHPNIVRYYTAWTEETAYRCESSDSNSSTSGLASKFLYIQMELCEGKTLRVWIDERNFDSKQHPFRGQDALPIFKQVLEAVKYLHSKNLFHRDLKPENIMFGKEGAVKVGDFGLATAAKGDNDEGLLERTKSTGTRSYMSPEQRTQSSYDKKVDIFALGLIYFELLWIFTTQSEKSVVGIIIIIECYVLWDDIRSKKFPKAFSERFNFEQQKLIDQMLCLEPMDRPDASELLTKLDLLPAAVQHRDKANRENRTY